MTASFIHAAVNNFGHIGEDGILRPPRSKHGMLFRDVHHKSNVSKMCMIFFKFSKFLSSQFHIGHSLHESIQICMSCHGVAGIQIGRNTELPIRINVAFESPSLSQTRPSPSPAFKSCHLQVVPASKPRQQPPAQNRLGHKPHHLQF